MFEIRSDIAVAVLDKWLGWQDYGGLPARRPSGPLRGSKLLFAMDGVYADFAGAIIGPGSFVEPGFS